jgi:cell division protein FtsQ
MYPSLSPEELRQRRRQLRRDRRLYGIKILWQLLLGLGVAIGLGLWLSQSDWTIRQPQQIRIQGNQALTTAAIRAQLALRYPTSLLQIQPQELSKRLLAQGSIAAATVHRELLPPRVTVQVRDRFPVALVSQGGKPTAMIDERGHWLPLSHYRLSPQQRPTLQLRAGAQPSCDRWLELYAAIAQSPVKVQAIGCQDPLNLTLDTEIGTLRLGSFDPVKIYRQLKEAHTLRDWQRYHPGAKDGFIDLENPNAPKFQSTRPAPSPSASAPN